MDFKVIVRKVKPGQTIEQVMNEAVEETRTWMSKAARGECAWICSDCCMTFQEGMPDKCPHGHDQCTRILKRDKEEAKK